MNDSYTVIKKVKIILIGFYCCITALIIWLGYLQFYKAEELKLKSEKNFLRFESIGSPRGSIFDCHDVALATNRPIFDVYYEGSGNYQLTLRQEQIIQQLHNLGLSKELEIQAFRKKILFSEKHAKRYLIASDISFDHLCKVSESCADSPNLIILKRFKRIYPHGPLASHLLGYLSKSDGDAYVGQYGFEKIFQKELEGKKGYVIHVTNSKGKCLEDRETHEAEKGKDLKLTIDASVQRIAEKLFKKDQAGVFILMDPEDGAIKALVSHPCFNPNFFVESTPKKEWDELFNLNSPFLNRAAAALYPPASVFKLVMYAAGIETGIVTPETLFTCRGYTVFCKRNYYCVNRSGHGCLNCRQLFAHSCNIPSYEIAKKISIDVLAEYGYRFGLGRSTGSLLRDVDGLIPTSSWKEMVKGERWWRGETLSASIGQSYLLVTPLQIIRMMGAICSGYLCKPRFLMYEPCETEPLMIKDSTLDFERESMKDAVNFGTARRMQFPYFDIYAKTGTAQTSSLLKSQLDKKYLEHGWVAGYFKYKNDKPLAFISLIEKAGSSRTAVIFVRNFLYHYALLKK